MAHALQPMAQVDVQGFGEEEHFLVGHFTLAIFNFADGGAVNMKAHQSQACRESDLRHWGFLATAGHAEHRPEDISMVFIQRLHDARKNRASP